MNSLLLLLGLSYGEHTLAVILQCARVHVLLPLALLGREPAELGLGIPLGHVGAELAVARLALREGHGHRGGQSQEDVAVHVPEEPPIQELLVRAFVSVHPDQCLSVSGWSHKFYEKTKDVPYACLSIGLLLRLWCATKSSSSFWGASELLNYKFEYRASDV